MAGSDSFVTLEKYEKDLIQIYKRLGMLAAGAGGPSVLVSAYLNAAQDNLAADTWTTVTLDTELFDIGGDFNTGTYTFTAPVAGYYLIFGKIQFKDSVDANSYRLQIYMDSATDIANNSSVYKTTNAASKEVGVAVSGIFYLAAAATIVLRAMAGNAGGTWDLVTGRANTFLHIASYGF